MNTTPILRATNIVKKLGGKTILNDVSLDVHKGDVKVVIGPSGAGKSTFLQCLNYLLPPDSGDIWLEGKKVNARDTRELCALRQQVGMIFQDFNLFDHLTAEENVSIALRKVMGCNKAEARNRALTELSRVGLAKRAALYPAQLSGGQKQRVAIARALAMDPKVMLLDEPTSALDPELVGEVLSVIRDLADGGMTMIMATHQMDFARALATEILFMERGRIIEQGIPDDLLAEVKRRWPRVIFDNTQAFFSAPRMDADSYNVYSCRKFVGVPDGAYLVHTGLTDGIYPADTSWQHAAFLFRCIDESVNSAYGDSLDNESRFDGEIRGMSPSTRRILASVEYDALRLCRRANYEALHAALAPHNALDCPAGADAMIYPFLCRVDGLRGRLIKNKVYVSQWWKYLLELLPADSVEADYSRYLLPLPIDQRYTPDDMRALAALVLQLKEEGEPA